MAAPYLGDYVAGETVYFMWNSSDANGASITRSTDGTISVYKDANTTQTTTGVTDTENFDGLTGVHHCAIATSDSFYTAGTDFMVVLSAATIDTRTVNAVIAHFSIENRSALRPTTAGRTLDVSAGGEAGVDWANVGSPTTAVNLSATNIDVDQVVASVSGAVGSVTGAVGSVAAGGITAASIATGAIDADATAADFLAEINAEVVDALATDTYAEPGQELPPATTTLAKKIGYLYKSWRNKKDNDGTTTNLYADDATTVDQKQATSESGGTVTKGEWATGP